MRLGEYRQRHLESAGRQWDDAVEQIRDLLQYQHSSENLSSQVREVTRLLFEVSGQTRYAVFGGIEDGFSLSLGGYHSQLGYDLLSYMEFVSWFVRHELLDDGNPGVGYYRNLLWEDPSSVQTFTTCGPDHPEGIPYFARDVDVLRGRWPGSKMLHLDGAIEILRWHEEGQKRKFQKRREMLRKHGEEWPETLEDIEEAEEVAEASRYTSLVNAILAR